MSGSKVKKSAGSINSLACFNEWDTAGAKRLKYPARKARQTSSGRLRACPGVVYFIRRHESLHVLYLELGVGANTPVIIKYPFWQMTLANEKAVYACLNYGESFCPEEIADRSICIDGDIGEAFETQIS